MSIPTANHRQPNNGPGANQFPTIRQPYWRDPSVQVVTETRVVMDSRGESNVEKKKYLEYPDKSNGEGTAKST